MQMATVNWNSVLAEEDFVQKLRVWFIRLTLGGATAIVWVLFLIQIVSGDVSNQGVPVATLILTVLTIISLTLLQRSRLVDLGSVLTLAGLIAVLFTISADLQAVKVGVAALIIVMSAFIMNRSVYILANFVVALEYISRVVSATDAGMVFNPDLAAMLVALGVLFILSLTARYFSETLQSFAGRNQRNTDLLQATAEVGQITTQILSLDELFNRSVELIRDRFAYYHVQVFLVDEDRKFARLVASTGDIGQKLLARQHRLAVGSQSVIGRVTQVGEPVVARDTDRDPLHSRNELLPNTRSELALPIFDGDRIIGALDVQSTRSNAFKPADVQALQVMANQLGTAIRNALLFQSQAESVQENKRLFFESEANLREIQRLNRQLTQRAWSDYLTNRRIVSGITARPDEVQEDAAWTPIMAQASQRRRPVAAENGSSTLAVPIVLRGEVIGAIEIEPGEQGHNDNMIELAQTVAQRLAISLDNARLFEEAQQSTAQEQRLNEIATRYQAASTVDDLLEITLTELSDVLKASGGSIRLGGFRASENGSSGQTDDGGTGA